VKNVKIKKG